MKELGNRVAVVTGGRPPRRHRRDRLTSGASGTVAEIRATTGRPAVMAPFRAATSPRRHLTRLHHAMA
jgi:hypothetical protein